MLSTHHPQLKADILAGINQLVAKYSDIISPAEVLSALSASSKCAMETAKMKSMLEEDPFGILRDDELYGEDGEEPAVSEEPAPFLPDIQRLVDAAKVIDIHRVWTLNYSQILATVSVDVTPPREQGGPAKKKGSKGPAATAKSKHIILKFSFERETERKNKGYLTTLRYHVRASCDYGEELVLLSLRLIFSGQYPAFHMAADDEEGEEGEENEEEEAEGAKSHGHSHSGGKCCSGPSHGHGGSHHEGEEEGDDDDEEEEEEEGHAAIDFDKEDMTENKLLDSDVELSDDNVMQASMWLNVGEEDASSLVRFIVSLTQFTEQEYDINDYLMDIIFGPDGDDDGMDYMEGEEMEENWVACPHCTSEVPEAELANHIKYNHKQVAKAQGSSTLKTEGSNNSKKVLEMD